MGSGSKDHGEAERDHGGSHERDGEAGEGEKVSQGFLLL